jgi:hypothetical protein
MSIEDIGPGNSRTRKLHDRLIAALADGPLTRAEWLKAAKCGIREIDRHYGYLTAQGLVVQQHLTERIQLSKTRWTQKSYTLYCLAEHADADDRRVVTIPLGSDETPRQRRVAE